MSKNNPLRGIVLEAFRPMSDKETNVTEPIGKVQGEVALDGYVRAQTSAPEVVTRIS